MSKGVLVRNPLSPALVQVAHVLSDCDFPAGWFKAVAVLAGPLDALDGTLDGVVSTRMFQIETTVEERDPRRFRVQGAETFEWPIVAEPGRRYSFQVVFRNALGWGVPSKRSYPVLASSLPGLPLPPKVRTSPLGPVQFQFGKIGVHC